MEPKYATQTVRDAGRDPASTRLGISLEERWIPDHVRDEKGIAP
jgi:hypothetical protein